MAPEVGLAPTIYRFKGGCNTLCYSGNPFFLSIKNEEKLEGFEATMQAFKTLGLDISCVPRGILHALYLSGVAFGDESGMSPDQKKRWRESVLAPMTKGRGSTMALVCDIIKK